MNSEIGPNSLSLIKNGIITYISQRKYIILPKIIKLSLL
jgi:hypothetical protein